MDRQQHLFCTGGSEGIGLELARQVWCKDAAHMLKHSARDMLYRQCVALL